MSNIVPTNDMAQMKAERDMRQLAQRLGMPVGMPQTYYTVPIRKDGRVVEWQGRWGKHGLLWIAHQMGNVIHVECRNILRSRQNSGQATAYCKLVYEEGWVSIEEGEAAIEEFRGQPSLYKHADTMARVRALEHAIVNITANGTRLTLDHPLDRPIVYEVKHDEQ